jgi:hypothetical protein
VDPDGLTNDFANLRLDGNGVLKLNLESGGGGSNLTGPTILSSSSTLHEYLVRIDYVKGGNHVISVWDGGSTAGSCTKGSLLGSITQVGVASAGSYATSVLFGQTPAGAVFYGSFKIEYSGVSVPS